MDKIDMKDKFFHGVQWDSPNIGKKLLALKQILHSGALLGTVSQGLDDVHRYGDKIFLSVYPGSENSKIFRGNGIARDCAFGMTLQSFYLILDSSLKDYYRVNPGIYPNECSVQSRIDFYPYLIGIGNSGCSIDYRLFICYYLNKYMSNELSFDEFINFVRELFLYSDMKSVISEIRDGICDPDFDYNYLEYVFSNEPKDFIFYDYYYDLRDIIEEMNGNIFLFDYLGYLVGDDITIKRVEKMINRLEDCFFPKQEYEDCVIRLCKCIHK